jgi:hypothetical protein
MKFTVRCCLCDNRAELFFKTPDKEYYRCGRCSAIFLAPEYHVSREDEKIRYEQHNNDVEDPRYHKFVEPIVGSILKGFNTHHCGLDFGAGTGPVIAKILREKGYPVELYDPFFWDNPELLERKYDFIVCCEVIEHFRRPAKEFRLLRSLLGPNGKLFCMTELYSETIDFKKWYYKNDPTHVFFYHLDTLAWIRSFFGFSSMETSGRLIEFSV